MIGLDFETSGTDPWGSAVPIEIGLAVRTPSAEIATFEALIGRWSWNVDTPWSEKSAAIHGITKDELAKAEPVKIVDIRVAHWLIEQGATNRMRSITVGWNVAGFDRQFITRWMPVTNSLLSYRTVDLNALVFGLAGDDAQAYKNIKDKANSLSVEGLEGTWHRAGFDAVRSLRAFERRAEW